MANVQKYTRTQIGGLVRHYERGQKEDGSYFQFGNQDIDTSKSHLNYNLAPDRDGGQLSFISRRTSEVQCLKRADVNVLCSWVVTAPKDLTDGEHELFFRESYKFLNERYADGSDKNVVSAYVHMDEMSPHLHYAFMPVVHDKKKNIDKVSAKIAIDRLDLQTFHQDLERHMAKIFGREIGILNDATKDGNRSVADLKIGHALEQAKNAEFQASKAKEALEHLEASKTRVEGEIRALRGMSKDSKTLTLEELAKIKPYSENKIVQKIGGSPMLTVFKNDWDNLIKTALQRAEVAEDTKQVQSDNKRLKSRVSSLLRDKKELEKKLEDATAQSKTTLTERLEMANLQSQLQHVPQDDLKRFLAQYTPKQVRQRGYER